MRPDFFPMDAPASVKAGAVLDVHGYIEKWVQVGGTFVGTVAVEGTIDEVTWEVVASAAAPYIVQVLPSFHQLRINVTAYASGTPTAKFAGFDARTV